MFTIEVYAVFAVVEYLHVAASFVVRLMLVDVVPADKFAEGEPLLLIGGVVSGPPPVESYAPHQVSSRIQTAPHIVVVNG